MAPSPQSHHAVDGWTLAQHIRRLAASPIRPLHMWGLRVIPASWPYSQGIYEAFEAMKMAGFTAYCCGDRHAPHVLVAAYDWAEDYRDVVNIRGTDRVTAAHLPTYDGLDIFAPFWAVRHHIGPLEPTVAAMLRLPPPGHPDAPTTVYRRH